MKTVFTKPQECRQEANEHSRRGYYTNVKPLREAQFNVVSRRIYIFYKTAEIQARQGERAFMTGVYTDVNDRNKAQFNAVLRRIYTSFIKPRRYKQDKANEHL